MRGGTGGALSRGREGGKNSFAVLRVQNAFSVDVAGAPKADRTGGAGGMEGGRALSSYKTWSQDGLRSKQSLGKFRSSVVLKSDSVDS